MRITGLGFPWGFYTLKLFLKIGLDVNPPVLKRQDISWEDIGLGDYQFLKTVSCSIQLVAFSPFHVWYAPHICSSRINCYSDTEWSKNHAIYSWHMFYLKKNKLHSNYKTKNNVILCVEIFTAFSDARIDLLLSSCLMQMDEKFEMHNRIFCLILSLVWRLVLAQENRDIYP